MLESWAWPFANILGGCIDSLKYQNNIFNSSGLCTVFEQCRGTNPFVMLWLRIFNFKVVWKTLPLQIILCVFYHCIQMWSYCIQLGWLACDVFSLTPMFSCLSQIAAISKECKPSSFMELSTKKKKIANNLPDTTTWRWRDVIWH